ncbi:MAG: hypothetical protein JO112_16850 [Planctomycetes bacterium]|nr:hypothetical protein [Planctomycetota bacterium]
MTRTANRRRHDRRHSSERRLLKPEDGLIFLPGIGDYVPWKDGRRRGERRKMPDAVRS